MIAFFIAISVFIFMYSFVGWRVFIPLGIDQPWKTILWIVLFLLALLPVVSIGLLMRRIETPINDILSWMAYLSLGFFYHNM